MIRVVVIDREGKQRAHHFAKKEITVGSGEKSDVILEDEAISRHHARILEKQGKHIVFDLKSDAGVFVNRRRISSPQVISPRDEIRVGRFVLRISSDAIEDIEVDSGRTICPRCGGPLAFKNLADYCSACDLAFA